MKIICTVYYHWTSGSSWSPDMPGCSVITDNFFVPSLVRCQAAKNHHGFSWVTRCTFLHIWKPPWKVNDETTCPHRINFTKALPYSFQDDMHVHFTRVAACIGGIHWQSNLCLPLLSHANGEALQCFGSLHSTPSRRSCLHCVWRPVTSNEHHL